MTVPSLPDPRDADLADTVSPITSRAHMDADLAGGPSRRPALPEKFE
jgi:hypothetical protein